MTPANDKPRKALAAVDKELRQHLSTAIDLISEKSIGHLSEISVLEVETRDSVRVRIEFGSAQIARTTSLQQTIHPSATGSKPVTPAQRARLARELEASGISEPVYAEILKQHGVTNADQLDRPTMTAVITAIETAGKQARP